MRLSALWLLLLLLPACSEDSATLFVELRTDLLAGSQFQSIETELSDRPFETEMREPRYVVRGAGSGDDFLTGLRVAEFGGLQSGTYHIRLSLRGTAGAIVARRSATVVLEGTRAVTLVLTRSCVSISCPGPSDAPELTECLGARCVDPTCTLQTLDRCGDLQCDGDFECPAITGCVGAVRCTDGVCLCQDRPAPVDGGTDAGGCSATETNCGDGRDDDCDGLMDCVDSDCADLSCNDGNACTADDRCTSGSCTGSERSCDDGNVCTDDACDPATGCTTTNNTAGCDDSDACTESDRCTDGTCGGEARTCSDANGCTDDGCNPATGCTFTNNTASCDDGSMCTTSDRCSGGSCTGNARNCNDGDACTDDGCNPSSGCTNTARAQHSTCGAAHLRCCGGSCVDIRSNTSHCGGCGLSCKTDFSCGQRNGMPSCGCGGPNADCNGSTNHCSGMSLLCSCDPTFGGSCPGPMTCHPLTGGADICTY